jgi:hypothetical protein
MALTKTGETFMYAQITESSPMPVPQIVLTAQHLSKMNQVWFAAKQLVEIHNLRAQLTRDPASLARMEGMVGTARVASGGEAQHAGSEPVSSGPSSFG